MLQITSEKTRVKEEEIFLVVHNHLNASELTEKGNFTFWQHMMMSVCAFCM
jgi:hypothetical protein